MSGTEFLLLAFLVIAVGYILWREQQPKTDAQREAEDTRRERMERVKEIQRQKTQKATRDSGDVG